MLSTGVQHTNVPIWDQLVLSVNQVQHSLLEHNHHHTNTFYLCWNHPYKKASVYFLRISLKVFEYLICRGDRPYKQVFSYCVVLRVAALNF